MTRGPARGVVGEETAADIDGQQAGVVQLDEIIRELRDGIGEPFVDDDGLDGRLSGEDIGAAEGGLAEIPRAVDRAANAEIVDLLTPRNCIGGSPTLRGGFG